MLRLLKIRAIVNKADIFELNEAQPLTIPCNDSITTVVVGNGFHFSRTLEVSRQFTGTLFYQVDSRIDDINLLYLIFLTLLFFGMFLLTEMRGFMIIANLPLLYLLYVLYFMRKNFILITAIGQIE